MLRRNFIGLLSALPFVKSWLPQQQRKLSDVQPIDVYDHTKVARIEAYCANIQSPKLSQCNVLTISFYDGKTITRRNIKFACERIAPPEDGKSLLWVSPTHVVAYIKDIQPEGMNTNKVLHGWFRVTATSI